MNRPFIDIVVPTFNRAPMLASLLSSLAAQRYPRERYRVIIVDDGSTDETGKVLQTWVERDDGQKVIHVTHAGQSAAKNAGWRAGVGEIVAFTDDDCVADPGWLDAIARAFAKRPDALGLQGRTTTVDAQVTPFTHQIVVRRPNSIYHGCNVAYRREALAAVGGFDEGTRYAEDSQIAAAVLARGPILFCPEMVILHPPRPPALFSPGSSGFVAWKELSASTADTRSFSGAPGPRIFSCTSCCAGPSGQPSKMP